MIPSVSAQAKIEIPNGHVLVDGRMSLDRIISRIDAARKSVVVRIFIWRDDAAGNRVGQALLDAAERGVEIVVRKDKLGALFELGEEGRQSFFHKNYGPVTAVKQRVINAYSSKPDLLSWVIQRPNGLVKKLRQHKNVALFDGAVRNDHSKFMIIDDEILFVGGMNFEQRNITSDSNGLVWRDYVIELVDENIVLDLKERLDGKSPGDSSFEFVLNDNTAIQRFEIKPRVLGLLNGATDTCRIEMAYFCDPDVRDGVIAAALRGVDVQIVVPAWANIQNERNLKTMREIFERTEGRVSIFLSPDMLHSKMIDIDDCWIIVGSANFNERALNKFSELDVLISGDSDCARQIRRTFMVRRDSSKKVTDIRELNYRRIKERCEYIFG
jgi:cardiolipin synthase